MLVFVLFGGGEDEVGEAYGNTMTNDVVYDRVRSFRTTVMLVFGEKRS